MKVIELSKRNYSCMPIFAAYTVSWAKQKNWNHVDIQTIKQSMRQMTVEKKEVNAVVKVEKQ